MEHMLEVFNEKKLFSLSPLCLVKSSSDEVSRENKIKSAVKSWRENVKCFDRKKKQKEDTRMCIMMLHQTTTFVSTAQEPQSKNR